MLYILKYIIIIILVIKILISQFIYLIDFTPVKTDEKFRMALSLSPFTDKNIREGYTYEYKEKQITSVEELQKLYMEKGSQKCMFV